MRNTARQLGLLLVFLTFLAASARAEVTYPSWVDKTYFVHHIQLMHRLHALVIPEVNWNNVSFFDALDDLAAKCRAADPTHQGIHFIVPLGTLHRRTGGFPVTFKGENVPLLTLLKKLANYYSYEVTDEDVKFVNLNWCETVGILTFFVPTGYFQLHPEDAISEEPGTYDVTSQVRASGVTCDSRIFAWYSPKLQKLKVRASSPEAWQDVDETLYP